MSECQDFLENVQHEVEQTLTKLLPAETTASQSLHQAMHYVTLGGGKRIRAAFAYAAGQMLDLSLPTINAIAASVELIHAYSLVHDDLPAMDDDALRRGKPTCHIAFDEATAILAGDALQCLAFETLTTIEPADRAIQLVAKLSQASGSLGMVGGQALDLAAEHVQATLSELQTIHHLKTGKLIEASLVMPAIAAGYSAQEAVYSNLQQFGQAIGLAFQIQDDILDVEGNTELLGKQAGQDEQLEKSTYPKLYGLDEAKRQANLWRQKALSALDALPMDSHHLSQIADFIIHRKS